MLRSWAEGQAVDKIVLYTSQTTRLGKQGIWFDVIWTQASTAWMSSECNWS